MKNIIIILFLILTSCQDKNTLNEKKIFYSELTEPQDYIYVELLSYYPASNAAQSNFYILKNADNNDTLLVVDKDNLPVSDFIKHYNGAKNTAMILRKSDLKNKEEYLVEIPSNYNTKNKRIYLGELIRLME